MEICDLISKKRSGYYNKNKHLICLKRTRYNLENKILIREKQKEIYTNRTKRKLNSEGKIKPFSNRCIDGHFKHFKTDKYHFEFE